MILESAIGWLASETGSYIYSLLVNGPCEKIMEKMDEQNLQAILAEYNRRFEELLNHVSMNEELDFDGLKQYTQKELFDSFFDSLLAETYSIRKEKRRRILDRAYEASSAVTSGQKKKVQEYIETVFQFIDTFTKEKLVAEQLIQLNLRDDLIMGKIHQIEEKLQKELVLWSTSFTDKNSFANMVDQIRPKAESTNAFHYLNQEIGFWGRDEEMNVLEGFLVDERAVLYTAVVAPGGCGKSKLVYEFVKQNRYNTEWEMKYLDGAEIHRLLSFPDYCYPRNLVLIVDYAGLYAEVLGKWLKHLLSLKESARPKKIRLILLEREGNIVVERMVISPAWKRIMESTGEQKTSIREILYTKAPFSSIGEMRALDDQSVKCMIEQYARKHGYLMKKEMVEQLLKHLSNMGQQGALQARPLIALFITQAYIEKQNVLAWNTRNMMEYFLERFDKQCQYLCNNNEEIVGAIKNLVFCATVMGPFNVDSDVSDYWKTDVEILEQVQDEEYMALLCGVNQENRFTNVIMPMEPDILGEYYVLDKLQIMSGRQKRLQNQMDEFWKQPEKCFAFLARCIRDYGNRKEFKSFFLDKMNILLPVPNSKIRIEAKSKLLHLMLITLFGNKSEMVIAEQIKLLYEANPKYQTVAEDYAASLMLEFRHHMGTFENFLEQEKNVDKIDMLRKKFPASQYLNVMYGKGLYNQIVSYCTIYKRGNASERSIVCASQIGQNMKKLEKLYKECPDNEQVKSSYQMAKFQINMSRRI